MRAFSWGEPRDDLRARPVVQVDARARSLPRSVRLYEDWAALLGTGRPLAWLQSCTVDEFLELLCGHFEVSREALVARAGPGAAPQPEAAAPEPRDALPGRRLAGAYACYSHAWSPYFEGRIIRGSLVVERRGGAARAGGDLPRDDCSRAHRAERPGHDRQARRLSRPRGCRRGVPAVDVPVPARDTGDRASRDHVRRDFRGRRSAARRDPDLHDPHPGRRSQHARADQPLFRPGAGAAFERSLRARRAGRDISRIGRVARRVPAGPIRQETTSKWTRATIPS